MQMLQIFIVRVGWSTPAIAKGKGIAAPEQIVRVLLRGQFCNLATHISEMFSGLPINDL